MLFLYRLISGSFAGPDSDSAFVGNPGNEKRVSKEPKVLEPDVAFQSSASDDESNLVPQAKWLGWKKTRDDIFGYDVEPWSESWALRLILDQGASEYLWNLVAKGKHDQYGMIFMVFHRFPSIFIDFHEFLWIFMISGYNALAA